MPVKIYPIVEAITGDATWTIKESPHGHGSTSIEKHIVGAPLDDTPEARSIRTHELAHIAYSPTVTQARILADKADIHDFELVYACEDARIQRLATEKNVEFERIGNEDRLEAMRPVFSDNPQKMLEYLVASLFTADEGPMGNLWERVKRTRPADKYTPLYNYMGIVREAVKKVMIKSANTFMSTLACAKLIQSMLEEYDASIKEKEEFEEKKGSMLGESELHGGDPIHTVTDTMEMMEEISGSSDSTLESLHKTAFRPFYSKRVTWGKMTIVKQPLMFNLLKHFRITDKKIKKEYGTAPTAMYRWCTDQAIFTTKKRMPGGTLLIDASGSMGLSYEQIKEVVEAAPMITVATYNGNGAIGELWVVAQKGKATDEKHLKQSWGMNVVDGPALRWLAEQEEPRVWMSDGGVTGVGDSSGPHLAAECNRMMLENKIVRARDIAKVLEVFSKLSQGRKAEVYGMSESLGMML